MYDYEFIFDLGELNWFGFGFGFGCIADLRTREGGGHLFCSAFSLTGSSLLCLGG